MGILYICAVQYGKHQPYLATELSARNVATVTEQLNFHLYLTLVNVNLNGHMRLVATSTETRLFDLKGIQWAVRHHFTK